MTTNQKINLNSALLQLQSLVVCIDQNAKIIDFNGDQSIFNNNLKLDQSLFSVFSTAEVKRIKWFQKKVSRTKTDSSFLLSCNSVSNDLFRVNLSVSKESNDLYLLSFLNDTFNAEEYSSDGISDKAYHKSYSDTDPIVMYISFDYESKEIVDCNNLMISKLGLSKKDNIIGKSIFSIFNVTNEDEFASLFRKKNLDKNIDGEAVELITLSGKIIPSVLYNVVSSTVNNKTRLREVALLDVSELISIQDKLQKERSYLQLLNNQLDQFVHTCSNELQEPLATIKFAGDVLNKLYGKNLDDKGRSYLQYIDEAVDRLTDQIKMLLNHAYIGEGIEKTKVDLNAILVETIKQLDKQIIASDAIVSVPENLPSIKGYGTELQLLFQNLISNGIKYKKPDTVPQIIIQAHDMFDYVEFLVSDNGIGIDSVNSKEIFKIFNKVYQNNPNKGTGIGLAHCQKIVQMHSGEIHVKSSLNVGSTFVFTLKK